MRRTVTRTRDLRSRREDVESRLTKIENPGRKSARATTRGEAGVCRQVCMSAFTPSRRNGFGWIAYQRAPGLTVARWSA